MIENFEIPTEEIAEGTGSNWELLENLLSRHHRLRRFRLHQLRVIGLANGVIQHFDQVVPAVIRKDRVLTQPDI